MSEVVGLVIGVVLGVWSTHRLERDCDALVHGRSLPLRTARVSPRVQGAAPLENPCCAALNVPWLLRHWLIRCAPIAIAFWLLAVWSTIAPLAALGGFWLGRTGYLTAAVLNSRRCV